MPISKPRHKLKANWTKYRDLCRHKISWAGVKKILTPLFFILVVTLLFKQAVNIEWDKVFTTFMKTPPLTLVTGLAIALACILVYGSYDLLGRYLTRARTGLIQNWFIAWISYAFNLNLGALVGGIAFRYRLYSKLGVSSGQATRIIGMSIMTNWLGYTFLAGLLLVFGQIDPPAGWAVNSLGLQVIGAVFIAVMTAYLWVCTFAKRRQYSLRNFSVKLPSWRLALIQLGLSSLHWTLMALTIYQFMPQDIGFTDVYAVLLVSGVAGAVTHIPGALGVLEAVFVMLLAGQADKATIIAALFAYRSVFYLAPLGLAVIGYVLFESFTKNAASS